MADDGKRLEELVTRMHTDADFNAKVKSDKDTALGELGWAPEAIAAFSISQMRGGSEKKSDYWGCGTDCGCISSVGKGGNCVCGGGSGSG